MIDISFEINGRLVEPDNMKDVLDITFMKHIKERINGSIATVRCAKHGRRPSVLVKGRNLDSLDYVVSGCCKELIEKANKNLK